MYGPSRVVLDAIRAAAEAQRQFCRMKVLLPRKATAAEAEQAKRRVINAATSAARRGEEGVVVPLSDIRVIFFHGNPCARWKFWRR